MTVSLCTSLLYRYAVVNIGVMDRRGRSQNNRSKQKKTNLPSSGILAVWANLCMFNNDGWMMDFSIFVQEVCGFCRWTASDKVCTVCVYYQHSWLSSFLPSVGVQGCSNKDTHWAWFQEHSTSQQSREGASCSVASKNSPHSQCLLFVRGPLCKALLFLRFGYKFLFFFPSPCDLTIVVHRVWTVWGLISHWISVDAFISALLQKILTLASVQSKNTLWGETNNMVQERAIVEHQVLHLVVL